MVDFWKKIHQEYKVQPWNDLPSIFAEEIAGYLPSSGNLLDLGAGQGQDSVYFAGLGFDVTSVDIEASAIELAKKKTSENVNLRINFEELDITKKLPFGTDSFDVVYSHLALHYFDSETTKKVMREIHRVLKTGGILAFLCNSINDPEYNTGCKLEENYFHTEGTTKRFFSDDDARSFTYQFEEIICDEKGETHKDSEKGVHHLVRYVGKK